MATVAAPHRQVVLDGELGCVARNREMRELDACHKLPLVQGASVRTPWARVSPHRVLLSGHGDNATQSSPDQRMRWRDPVPRDSLKAGSATNIQCHTRIPSPIRYALQLITASQPQPLTRGRWCWRLAAAKRAIAKMRRLRNSVGQRAGNRREPECRACLRDGPRSLTHTCARRSTCQRFPQSPTSSQQIFTRSLPAHHLAGRLALIAHLSNTKHIATESVCATMITR